MPKQPKAPAATTTLPRPGTPMPVEVQDVDNLRPVVMSLEGKTLTVESIDERLEEDAK